MFGEILIGFIIALILVYLLYSYLAWCSANSSYKILYKVKPELLSAAATEVIQKYGDYMLPEYLSDSYKPLRFWILYYLARATV